MKNITLLLIVILSSFYTISAQTATIIGVKGGLNLTFVNVNEANFGENTETEVGFYGGVYFDLNFGENFHLQPEVLYVSLNDFKFLNAPIYLKYSASEQFDILVGPSMNYFFDFFSNKLKVRADLGLNYNFSERLNTHIKYTIGFEEITPNGLFLGIGYRL